MNSSEDFWLHRYTSANFLEKMFKGGDLNLKFTKAINFEDPLEGWDLRNPQIKEAMDHTLDFYNRVIEDQGDVDLTAVILAFHANTTISGLKKWVTKLNEFSGKRNSTFISSWFKTDSLKEENRAMWRLYGNNEDGVRISVKWSDLKQALLKINEKFQVGVVDYGMNNEGQDLFFTKDISYKHENEFRILFYNENTTVDQFIKMDKLKVHATVRSKDKKDFYVNRLKKMGFEKGFDTNNKLTYDESQLFYESKQVDWSVVLDIINRELS
jgi:hypothetical protein